jgi:hypothetical protein
MTTKKENEKGIIYIGFDPAFDELDYDTNKSRLGDYPYIIEFKYPKASKTKLIKISV